MCETGYGEPEYLLRKKEFAASYVLSNEFGSTWCTAAKIHSLNFMQYDKFTWRYVLRIYILFDFIYSFPLIGQQFI